MDSNKSQSKYNVQNILLGMIALFLLAQLILAGVLLSMQIRQSNANTAAKNELREMMSQYKEKNNLANEDLLNDYKRDRDVYAQLQADSGNETDPQLQQIITGNDYIIYSLMRLAEQDNQILELLSE